MTIAICGSIKFYDKMVETQRKLEKLGHKVLMPNKAEGVDYWAKDNKSRVEAKKKFRFIDEHLDKIEKSDAVSDVTVLVIYKNNIGLANELKMVPG